MKHFRFQFGVYDMHSTAFCEVTTNLLKTVQMQVCQLIKSIAVFSIK